MRSAIRLAAVLAASLCAACTTDVAGYSIVAQDKYDFMSCTEINNSRRALAAREKDLSALVEKAESSPGGVIASYMAYRSELTDTRARLRFADRSAARQNCDAPTK
jgi:hypothetical protein